MSGRYDDALFWAQKNLEEAIFLRPDHYLDLARIYRLQNLKNLAGETLIEAINKFGILPSLTSQLLQILVETGGIDQAIQWQNKIVSSQKRREFALFDRARLYILAGNIGKAINDLRQAQSGIGNLPAHIQNSEAVVQLIQKTGALLQQIKMQGP